MVCPKCGANVNDGDNFCEECGASINKASSSTNSETQHYPDSKAEVLDINLAAVTNIGRKHPTNEDAGTVLELENGSSVLIVSDGVSSSYIATSASQMAINVIKETFDKNSANAEELIKSAINNADTCIKELPYETRDDGIYGPEATVVVAIVQEGNAAIGWVGDSRAYIINNDKQELLTVDDSWIELVVSEGSMTREEAIIDRRAHYVTQVLGMHDQNIEIHITKHNLEPGDMLLLCSDGLWNYFQGEDALLKAISAFGMNSEAVYICENLIGLANSAGGHDNITAALLKA